MHKNLYSPSKYLKLIKSSGQVLAVPKTHLISASLANFSACNGARIKYCKTCQPTFSPTKWAA